MKAVPDLTDLSLEQKVGQVVCFGWSGDDAQRVNDHARALVEWQVGSVVLMGRNVADPLRTREMLAELQELSAIPLLVAVDQEGGSVNRFKHPLHQFPGNMALGAIAGADPEAAVDLTRAQAAAQARELRAIGIHWDFAPVADVNNNPDNPIIGVRSYGESPELVAWLAAAAIDGYQQNGILACAKHFPGHGDTSVDSHLALPTVAGDWDRISATELPPFRSVIEAAVGSIMTTHILFPALDASAPATLSAPLLTGLLRNRMEFSGIVVTDCLEMDAIAKSVGTAQGAVQALRAGADVVLVCHTRATQEATINAILNAVDYGEIPEARLDEAVGRVLAAKRLYTSGRGGSGTAPTRNYSDPWNDSEHDALEQRIALGAVTVVRNSGLIPLREEGKVLMVSAHPAAKALADRLAQRLKSMELIEAAPHFPDDETEQILASIIGRSKEIAAVIVATAPREAFTERPIDVERQAAAVLRLHEAFGDRLVAVALKEPYDIRRFSGVGTYVCGYGYSAATLDAIAAALAGEYSPTGRLPVTIPDVGL